MGRMRCCKRWLRVAAVLAVLAAEAPIAAARTGLELGGGILAGGAVVGWGSGSLPAASGPWWSARVGVTVARTASDRFEWRSGLTLQQWEVGAGTAIRYTVTTGPTPSTWALPLEPSQTFRELVVPFAVRLRAGEPSPWFLDLAAEFQVLLSARERTRFGTPAPAASRARPGGPLRGQAEIFEDAGTFGGDRDVRSRFTPVAAGARIGVGRWLGRERTWSFRAQVLQGLTDRERASRAVVRPTRLEAAIGHDWGR